jgi:hypothetical protein
MSIVINVVGIFPTQQFQRKKHVMECLESSFQSKGHEFNPFPLFVLPIIKMDEIYT